MMPEAWLRARLRSHNRHAIGLALLAAASAALAWFLAWAFFMLMLLGFLVATRGEGGAQSPPWAGTAVAAIVAVLFVWGLLDQFRHRYMGVTDRQVIGWHVIPDVLLLPARLTFAIWGNLGALRLLDRHELARAWELLAAIRREGRARLRSLTLVEPDSRLLFKLVTTLQMLDLIDLHRGEGDWFYTVRSTQLETLGHLLEGPG
jgi:hypothetical protein